MLYAAKTRLKPLIRCTHSHASASTMTSVWLVRRVAWAAVYFCRVSGNTFHHGLPDSLQTRAAHVSGLKMALYVKDGTPYDESFEGVATGIDGTSVVFAGYTFGTWVAEQAEDEDDMDAVGMSMDGDGTLLWTYQVSCLRSGRT